MNSFDDFLDQKNPIGKYHRVLMFLLCLLTLSFGSTLVFGPFILRIIQNEYLLTFNQMTLVGPFTMIGSLTGNIVMGFVVSKIGSKNLILVSLFIGSMYGVGFYYMNNIYLFLLFEFLIGFSLAQCVYSIMMFVVESFTKKYRGRALVLVYSFMTAGKILGSLLMLEVLSPYKFEIWKILYLSTSAAIAIVFVLFVLFAKSSHKFKIHIGKFREAYEDFRAIQKFNHTEEYLIRNNMVVTYQEFKETCQLFLDEERRRSSLLHVNKSLEYIKKIFFLWVIGVCFYYSMSGQTIGIPYVLGFDEKSLFKNLIIIMAELLASLVTFFTIDHPKIGRRRLILFSCIFSAINYSLIFISNDYSLFLLFFF